MAAKQPRSNRKLKAKHRAVKPRPVRPLDVAKEDNHAARHEAKKERRAAHEALMKRQAEEKAAREQAEREAEDAARQAAYEGLEGPAPVQDDVEKGLASLGAALERPVQTGALVPEETVIEIDVLEVGSEA